MLEQTTLGLVARTIQNWDTQLPVYHGANEDICADHSFACGVVKTQS